jgi:hypothetical protein
MLIIALSKTIAFSLFLTLHRLKVLSVRRNMPIRVFFLIGSFAELLQFFKPLQLFLDIATIFPHNYDYSAVCAVIIRILFQKSMKTLQFDIYQLLSTEGKH